VSEEPRAMHLDLSGIRVQVTGDDDPLFDLWEGLWPEWISSPAETPDLDVRFRLEGPPPERTDRLPKILESRLRKDRAEFQTGEGRIVVEAGGSARATVRRGDVRFRLYGLQNLLLAALSWVLPRRGGLLLHGAGILLQDQAVVLVGPENAGKSTWIELAREAGARPVSEDLLLIDASGPRPAVLGSPFRADRVSPCGPGRWTAPLFLKPEHGERARLAPGSRLAFQAVLSANLPFAAGTVGRGGELDRLLDRLSSTVEFRTLFFAKDPSFLPVLEDWLESRRRS